VTSAELPPRSPNFEEAQEALRRTCDDALAQAPDADQPTDEELPSLLECDAEALYYGIDRPVDFAAARKCAFAQLKVDNAPIYGGAGILMMIYANGNGVRQNLDLAVKYACDYGGATAELGGRLYRVDVLRAGKKLPSPFDLCDDASSGYLAGFCAGHDERMVAGARIARKNEASADLPKREFERLEQAAKAYFDAREKYEVDLTGTMRSANQVEERTKLEDAYVAALEQFTSVQLPEERAGNSDRTELVVLYQRLMECRGFQAAGQQMMGAISTTGIEKTHQQFQFYREAWIALGLKVRPNTKRGEWYAWITRPRIEMLKELATGC
jgi:hypothetical protein